MPCSMTCSAYKHFPSLMPLLQHFCSQDKPPGFWRTKTHVRGMFMYEFDYTKKASPSVLVCMALVSAFRYLATSLAYS